MAELIATIILVGSLMGMGVILFRKVPALAESSRVSLTKVNWQAPLLKLKEKIKTLNSFKSFSYEIFLQKTLSKIRILILKTDNKTSNWLQRLREKSRKKKEKANDNYWEEIKKSTSQKGRRKRIGKKEESH